MLELYALVPKIHLVQSHLPFHERVKVVAKLGCLILTAFSIKRARLLNWYGGLYLLSFLGEKERLISLQIPNKIPPGSAVCPRGSKRFAWNRQLASVTLSLVLRCCINLTKPERQQPMPNNSEDVTPNLWKRSESVRSVSKHFAEEFANSHPFGGSVENTAFHIVAGISWLAFRFRCRRRHGSSAEYCQRRFYAGG